MHTDDRVYRVIKSHSEALFVCWPIHSHIFGTTEGNFIWLIEIKVEWLSNERNQILETFWDDDTDVSLLTPRQTGWWVVLELIQKTIYLVEQTFNIQSTFQSYQSMVLSLYIFSGEEIFPSFLVPQSVASLSCSTCFSDFINWMVQMVLMYIYLFVCSFILKSIYT